MPCGKGVAGCGGKKDGRGFKVGSGTGWEVLDDIWDTTGASWLDVDDDVRFSLRAEGKTDWIGDVGYHDSADWSTGCWAADVCQEQVLQ